MSTPKRRTISPFKVVRDEATDGCWWVMQPDGEGGYVEADYFDTRDEAMDAAVRYRAADQAASR
jgi:hypothetical protein